ncbi:MAG: polysaccharide deacetylase family protein [Bacteroidota bacterium]
MKKYLFLFLFLWSVVVNGQEKKICITVDDLPTVTYRHGGLENQQIITKGLLSALKQHDAPAIGFVNERKLHRKGKLDSARYYLLKDWLDAGMELGNHTYSHPDYNRLTLAEYKAEIQKGEVHTRPLVESYGQSLVWFRHPFLHTGQTEAKNDSLDQVLEELNYQTAFVTIDNEEYLFAYAYDSAMYVKDEPLMKKVADDYIFYMQEKLLFYENMSRKLFGRNIPHTLLLHANRLNADYLDELLQMHADHGYSFVSIEEASSDVAYEHPISWFGRAGISWLDRWALTEGKKGDFFSADPPSPAYIKALARIR